MLVFGYLVVVVVVVVVVVGVAVGVTEFYRVSLLEANAGRQKRRRDARVGKM